jgi:ketosteroid isomerase-like protein
MDSSPTALYCRRRALEDKKGAEVTDQSNVQIIHDIYDAFVKGDMETLGQLFADDIVWRDPGRNPLAGVYHSKEEVFQFFGRVAELSSGTFRLEVRAVFGCDETVVGLATLQAERNGKTHSGDAVQVWKVKNGKAVEFVNLEYDPYAADEFWS